MVSREITSRNIDTSSTRFGCLDQLALELDGESQVLGNWQSLAQKLGVTFHALKMLQRKSYSNREATFQLFRHLRFRHRSMTVKTLKEALAKMKRGDVPLNIRVDNDIIMAIDGGQVKSKSRVM